MAEPGYEQGTWDFWQDQLDGKDMSQHLHESEIHTGYWRMRRRKDGPLVAVATWQDDDNKMVGALTEHPAEPAWLFNLPDRWTYICDKPVSREHYNEYCSTGRWWDDAPSIGHNAPPELNSDDPATRLEAMLNAEGDTVKEFLHRPVETQDQADQAASWVKRLTGLNSEVEAAFKEEKAPHLEAGRAVDEKWRGLRGAAKELADQLRAHVQPWADRLARAQAAAAEKLRSEAEAAERKAQVGKTAQERAEAEAEAAAQRRAAEEVEKAKVSAGRTGSKISTRKVVYAEIVDYDKAVAALKHRDEMRELVQSLANRAAKAGVALDGVKIVEEQKVR